MRINWKTAFWIQLGVFAIIVVFLFYSILDQGVTLTYMQEGYSETQADFEQLSSAIKGKLSRRDCKGINERFPNSSVEDLQLNRVKISFDAKGTVDSITTNW